MEKNIIRHKEHKEELYEVNVHLFSSVIDVMREVSFVLLNQVCETMSVCVLDMCYLH